MKELLYQADLGDGRYRNPILYCDYSDPDVIRVGDTYYMTASSFQYTPGLPVLISRDLVNWELVSYAIDNIEEPGYDKPRHGDGVWAPAIRCYDGVFYIFYGMPDEGIYCVKTRDPRGKWDAPVLVRPAKGFIDPCPYLDTDGRMYVVHAYAKSRIGFKSMLGIFEISRETLQAISEDSFIFDGNDPAHPAMTIEGPKVYRRDGYVYILAPAGGVTYGDQRALRARDVHGPYEIKTVCHQGSTSINGPHQGGLTDTVNGDEWFMNFQDAGMYGRITHLQPVHWKDGWPVIGANEDAQGCGEPVSVCGKPDTGVQEASQYPAASDDFSGGVYGRQWQWTANHEDALFLWNGEREETDGLALRALRGTQGKDTVLWNCPNLLTQKFCCPIFEAQTEICLSHLTPGARAGLCVFGGQYAALEAFAEENGEVSLRYLESSGEGKVREESVLWKEPLELAAGRESVLFGIRLEETAGAIAFYRSADGEHWEKTGRPFVPSKHTWVGARAGLYALSAGEKEAGYALFKNFQMRSLEKEEMEK